MGRLVGCGMIGFGLAYPAHESLTVGQITILLVFGVLLIFGPKLHGGKIAKVVEE